MSIIHNVTKTITGVEHSKDAGEDVRSQLISESFEQGDDSIADRYVVCSQCKYLKEEFKLFGKTISSKTPTCAKCGCNLNLKLPLSFESCPEHLW